MLKTVSEKAEEPAKTHIARSRLEMVAGYENEMCGVIEKAIINAGLPVYVKAGRLVEAIEADTIVEDHGGYEQGRAVRLIPVDLARMMHLMGDACIFLKFDSRKRDFVPVTTPENLAKLILARVGHWPFPEVTNIVAAQTLDKHGNVIDEPGVHRPSRLLLAGLPTLPSISTSADKNEAIGAIKVLNNLLAEFEFVDQASRSVALSMLMTPVCRGIIPLAPMHAVTAPTPGSGKSYLSRLASLIATGRPCPVIPPADNPEEFEKRLIASMMAGPSIISLDNITGRLGSATLCQALSEQMIDVRPLGTSNTMRIDQRVTWFANGNNLTIIDDLTRRTLLATLDRNEEDPESHEYRSRPDAQILQDRGKYVGAILTIVGNYIKSKGRVRLPPLASYEGWSKSVRESLVWLDYEDPVLSMKNVKANDPERAKRLSVVETWPSIGTGYTATRLAEIANDKDINDGQWTHPDLREALLAVAGNKRGDIDTTVLGNWLRKQNGKVFTVKRVSLKLISKMGRSNKTLWLLINLSKGAQEEKGEDRSDAIYG